MGQSFNSKAIIYSVQLLFRPRLILPQLVVSDIRNINYTKLKQAGFKAIAFDKDNTLSAPYSTHVHPEFKHAFEECTRNFGKNIIIVSNSCGSSDDVDGKDVSLY
jgi:phosphatidylglycerophosphatase GEP4